MNPNENTTTQKLIEAFSQFKRLNWHQSPIIGLTSSEILVLFCINKAQKSDTDGIKVSEISRRLKVASPTVTQLINSLENNGYVERKADKEDRRAVRINLTDKGKDAIKKAMNAFTDSFDGLVEYLGEEKSLELASLLSQAFAYFNEKTMFQKI